MRLLSPTLLLFVLLAAGCTTKAPPPAVQPEDPLPTSVNPWDAVRSLLEGVPCEAAFSDAATTANLKQLAKIDYAKESKMHGELDVRGDLLLIARFQAGGFEVVNISDPLHPANVSSFTDAPPTKDVKFSPDNQTALVGHTGGIVLVDITHPDDPVKVGEWKFPPGPPTQNAHMLATARIGGTDWVFMAPNSNSGTWIFKLEGPPEARKLTYVTQTLPVEGGLGGPHDLYVTFDVDLQKWLLYDADGFHGWLVFDVSNPAQPTLLGGSPMPETGYTHTIQAAKINGKRIVATIQEVGANFLKIYDATNLQTPTLLAAWNVGVVNRAPTEVIGPQHNFNIVAGKLYLAHYTKGVYIFDLKDATGLTSEFNPVAHFAPETPHAMHPLGFGNFWDAVVKDGILYAGDSEFGVYAVGYGCNEAGDAALTSTG